MMNNIYIIGHRQTKTTLDVVEVIPSKVNFAIENTLLPISIPTTSNTDASKVKLLNLRRMKVTITITGVIKYGSDNSKTGIALSSLGVISGGSSVTSVLKKKWLLEQMAFGGSVSAKGMTFQYRDIINPSSSSAAPTEYDNIYHEKVFIRSLAITDSSKIPQYPQSGTPTRYEPKFMSVRMVLTYGDVTV